MAGNPFRKANTSQPVEETPHRDITPPPSSSQTTKKRVKIQTPPRSPEDAPRRLSEGRISPPPPLRSPDDDGDSDSTTTGGLELEEAARNTRRNSGSLIPTLTTPTSTAKAPYNPFARTLATSEAAYGIEQTNEGQQETGRKEGASQPRAVEGRAALDVDEFKSILLTGSAGPSPAVSSWQRLQVENSSGTDTSSLSKHSLFDPALEIHPETPRSSIDHMELLESPSESESDEEEDSSPIRVVDRLDQLPKKHTDVKSSMAKGPQNVSFDDFEESVRSTSSQATTSIPPTAQSLSDQERSASDFNKAVPDAPSKLPTAVDTGTKVSANSLPASQQAKSIAVTPENSVPQKKAPPPLPAARRAGLEHTRTNSKSNFVRDSTQDEVSMAQQRPIETTAKSAALPPPPPPSRKARPTSQIATPLTETPPPVQSPAPAPFTVDAKPERPAPPPRNSSKARSVVNRSSSSASHSSTTRAETLPPSLTAPPAPPPRRSGATSNRTSVDGRPPSLNETRRSSEYSIKTERTSSLPHLQNVTESGESQSDVGASASSDASKVDILADMSAFQAEIDALRAKAFSNAG